MNTAITASARHRRAAARHPRGARLAAPLMLAALISTACGERVPPTWEDVATGACSHCEHEIVDLREPDRLLLRRIVSYPVQIDRHRDYVRRFQWIDIAGVGVEQRIVAARFVDDRDGRVSEADADTLARWTICQDAAQRRRRPEGIRCGREGRLLPLDVSRDGVLVVQVDAEVSAIFPDGHRSRVFPPFDGDRKGITVLTPPGLPLYTHGDFVPLADGSGLAWAGGDAREAAVSTVADWATVAAGYRSREEEALGTAATAPPAATTTDVATAERALQEAAEWIARELRYDGTRMDPADSFVPGALDETLASRRGDCKAFALVLRHLLAKHGVGSESVFVKLDSTAAPRRRIPGPPDVDHVVVYIPTLDRYVDATLGDPAAIRDDARTRFAYAIHTGDGRFRVLR